MSIVTEVVTMKLMQDIKQEDFVHIVDNLEKEYHSKQPGFLDTELFYDERNDQWVMVQHWETEEQMKSASQKIFKDSTAEAFVKSLDPRNVKMIIGDQIKCWRLD